MAETVTLSRDELNTLIAQQVAQQVAQQTRHGTAGSDDPLLREVASLPPRSFPLRNKREEMAAQAEIRGGVWHPEYADIRKYRKCAHAHPTQCDRCWTAETEARWAFALGLSDEEPIPLDDIEVAGSQRANVPTTTAERKRLGGRLPSNAPG